MSDMNKEDILRMAEEASNGEVREPRVLEMLKTVQEAAAEREACAALLLKIKQQCQDANRLWQVEEFIDAAIRAMGMDTRPSNRKGMNVGDIVQIAPKVEFFGGCFLVVTEVFDGGVMGYGQNAGQSDQWWLRVKNEDINITFGHAVWGFK